MVLIVVVVVVIVVVFVLNEDTGLIKVNSKIIKNKNNKRIEHREKRYKEN